MSTIVQQHGDAEAYTPVPYPIHWSAVTAGLVFTFAVSWLLFMLGSAIGLSIFEFFNPYDPEFKPEAATLNTMVIIWVFLSSIIGFYLGGLLAGRLTGIADRAVGLLHGIAVWASAVVVSVILGSFGVNGIVNSSLNALKGLAAAGGGAAYWLKTDARRPPDYLEPLTAAIKREMSKAVAGAVNETAPGAPVPAQTVKAAVDQLSKPTLVSVASALLQGNTQLAKDVLASSTTLTDAQVEQIVQAAKIKADEMATALKAKADTVEDYVTGILWLVFLSSTAALLAAIAGGWMGVETIARMYSVKLY